MRNEVAADDGGDEAAVQRAHERRDLVVLVEQTIEARELVERFARFRRLRAAGSASTASRRSAPADQGAHACAGVA